MSQCDLLARARTELKLFQSNVMAKLADGSELRAVFNGAGFEDFDLGEPMRNVVDYWVDERVPDGGFNPMQHALAL